MKFAVIARLPRDKNAERIMEGRQYDLVADADAHARALRMAYEDVTVLSISSPRQVDWKGLPAPVSTDGCWE